MSTQNVSIPAHLSLTRQATFAITAPSLLLFAIACGPLKPSVDEGGFDDFSETDPTDDGATTTAGGGLPEPGEPCELGSLGQPCDDGECYPLLGCVDVSLDDIGGTICGLATDSSSDCAPGESWSESLPVCVGSCDNDEDCPAAVMSCVMGACVWSDGTCEDTETDSGETEMGAIEEPPPECGETYGACLGVDCEDEGLTCVVSVGGSVCVPPPPGPMEHCPPPPIPFGYIFADNNACWHMCLVESDCYAGQVCTPWEELLYEGEPLDFEWPPDPGAGICMWPECT